jgi:anti-sigma factor RsiW
MWPLSGVLAAILIVVGIVLLIAYAVRRGLVHDALPDTVERAEVPTDGPAPTSEPPSRPRTLGALGAVILVVGLALGVFTAVSGGWSAAGNVTGSCAQSWNGCPQVTAPPASSPGAPSVVP